MNRAFYHFCCRPGTPGALQPLYRYGWASVG
jgi:hypothetical protein